MSKAASLVTTLKTLATVLAAFALAAPAAFAAESFSISGGTGSFTTDLGPGGSVWFFDATTGGPRITGSDGFDPGSVSFTCYDPGLVGHTIAVVYSGDDISATLADCYDGEAATQADCEAGGLYLSTTTAVCDSVPASCGDGTIGGIESCDDGNTTAGDGCDSVCAVEVGYACSGEPSVCALEGEAPRPLDSHEFFVLLACLITTGLALSRPL